MKRQKIVAVITLVLLVALLFLVLNLPRPNPKSSFEDGSISLSTNKTSIYQKAPYPVVDFFERQEDITLFAEVSYRGAPSLYTPVGFRVDGPQNRYENVSFFDTAITNSSGVGSFRFRIPSPIENYTEVVFGNWTVTAQTRLGSDVYTDAMIFRVSWPVEILSLKTVDENRFPRANFPNKGDVGVEIMLRNNNAVPAKAVITGVVFDNLSTVVGYFELKGLEIPPGIKNKVYTRLTLSDNLVTFSGGATLHVGVYDERRLPYCPSSSTRFVIYQNNPQVFIVPQDVALVDLSMSRSEVDIGESVEISAVVRNTGSEVQNFTVIIYDNEFPVAALKVVSLNPNFERTLRFIWNTANASYGKQSIRALATAVPWEVNLADNSSPTRTLTLSFPSPPSEEGTPRSLFLILLLILLLFLVTAVAAVVYRRKKEKPFDPNEFTFFFLD